ncbi:MAG: bifunctional demethylmenaquinone methyltransferase/2-methoxy-6-polyprenyl-1,4-benzoquinol methylase UbiE [Coriobacteriia bacterium]|nr:bifunctional demethylmenaquinone methyltransferase/2-methoxy-6-polyprenyl-1,4-benzoquinol methylase UbiE [Coriobacteriia bacterium]
MPDNTPVPGRPTTERVSAIFSNIAGRYDAFNIMASFGIDRLWRRRLVCAAALTPTSRVLDLCSGTGDVAFALAEQGRPGEVVATDFVPEMLAVAEEKAARRDLPCPVVFSVADAQKLPFADATFDVLTVAFGVRNLPRRESNFAEALRVLKPGGRYVILEFSRPTFAPWRAVYHVYLRYVIPTIGWLLTGDRAGFVYLNDSIRQFPRQEALAVELRDAGFSAVTWENLTGGIVALHTAVK